MKRVADLLVDTLVAAGVERIYGLAGDSLNGVTYSIRPRNNIKWVPGGMKKPLPNRCLLQAPLQLNQSAACCGCDSFRAANYIQFTENTFDVCFHRAFADEQLGTDLFVTLACGNSLQHFDLARAQGFAADALGQLGGEHGRYAGFPTMHFPNALHQCFARAVL